MMKYLLGSWIVLFLASLVTAIPKPAAAMPEPFFSAGFNQGLDADIAPKSRQPVFQEAQTDGNGFLGAGLKVSPGGFFYYRDLPMPDYGTINLRLKPAPEAFVSAKESYIFMTDDSDDCRFCLRLKGKTIYFDTGDGKVTQKTIVSPEPDVYADEWCQLAVAWKFDAGQAGEWKGGLGRGEVRIYFNGALLVSSLDVRIPEKTSGRFYLASDRKGRRNFPGTIDEVKIYGRFLEPSDIRDIFQAGL